jgi:uncharacterized RDD family membrane protein YckC
MTEKQTSENKRSESEGRTYKFLFFKCRKALPNQAAFLRRFFAFTIDSIVIYLLTILVFLVYFEIKAAAKGEPGLIARAVEAIKKGEPFLVTDESDEEVEKYLEMAYRNILKKKLPPEEYERTEKMSLLEIKSSYRDKVDFNKIEKSVVKVRKGIEVLKEIVVAYIYFILFFRFRAQTPGKRLFRLKVVDLKGKSRLGWYQSLERAHGYAASALLAGIGFLQVLWDKEGLTMHDKIASTTVIKLPKKEKVKPKKLKSGKTKMPKGQDENS